MAGVRGVIDEAGVKAGKVKVIAPAGFMEAISGENVLAGLPMIAAGAVPVRTLLPRGPRGQVDAGLGKGVARGTPGLIAPTQSIREPIEKHTIDGLGDRLPARAGDRGAGRDAHVLSRARRAQHGRECLSRCCIISSRCAARWRAIRASGPKYIADAIALYAPQTDVLIGQHHWPTWGRDAVIDHLEAQRDLYKHIHDQTLALHEQGLAAGRDRRGRRPAAGPGRALVGARLLRQVSHNVKAVYQRYLSWYDGNPCNLHALPPAAAARKFVEYMGGAAAVIARARADFAKGEFRWVAQVMKEAVYAEPDNLEARALCADALEQMGYQAESATWRNAFLYGAQELRHGVFKVPARGTLSADTLAGLSSDVLFDTMAIRLDPAKAAGQAMVINWHFTDRGEKLALTLKHCTLSHRLGEWSDRAAASIVTDARHARCGDPRPAEGAGRARLGRAVDRGRRRSPLGAVRHVRSALGHDVRRPDAG
jgi:alkyl sulfatase BDS1-like metallo-beta-lactamase superfamily hydrolase